MTKKLGKRHIARWLALKQRTLRMNTQDFATAANIPYTTLRTYLDPANPNAPQPEVLRRIAEFAGISLLEMFMIAYDLPHPDDLDPAEHHLLDLYRQLSDQDRKHAIQIIEILANRSPDQTPEAES